MKYLERMTDKNGTIWYDWIEPQLFDYVCSNRIIWGRQSTQSKPKAKANSKPKNWYRALEYKNKNHTYC